MFGIGAPLRMLYNDNLSRQKTAERKRDRSGEFDAGVLKLTFSFFFPAERLWRSRARPARLVTAVPSNVVYYV